MGMIGRKWVGKPTAAGTVEMQADPDYSRGDSFTAWMGVGAYNRFGLSVTDLDGAVSLQGCDLDPTVEANWYDMITLSADGQDSVAEQVTQFVRVNLTTLTSGTPTIGLVAEG